MLKKIYLCLCLLFTINSAFALDFLGVNLEDLNRKQVTELLNKNGAKLKKKDNLVDTFSLSKSKIPYAKWAFAYYNKQNEFVGLKIGFDYEDHNLINLRLNLVNKYGENYKIKKYVNEYSGGNSLEKEYFFDIAVWRFPNNTSIEYNADSFSQNREFNEYDSFAFLFFRHDERRESLLKQLKNESKTTDDEKFKGVF